MKKFICGFVIGAILSTMIGVFAATYVAETANFSIMVNGENFETDKPVLAVDGSTYLPLKAIGEALGVPVVWNESARRVEIGDCSSAPATVPAGVAAEQAVTGYIKAVIALDGKTASSYVSPSSQLYTEIQSLDSIIDSAVAEFSATVSAVEAENGLYGIFDGCDAVFEKYMYDMFAMTKYEITEVSVSGNTATVGYKMQTHIPDSAAAENAMAKVMSEEAMNKLLTEISGMSEEAALAHINKYMVSAMETAFNQSLENITYEESTGTVVLENINGKWLVISD